MSAKIIAIVLAALSLSVSVAFGAAALSGIEFGGQDYSDIYMEDDIYALGDRDERCRGGVDSKTGRTYAEIDRCGIFHDVSDEQVLIAQMSREKTLRRLAKRTCKKDWNSAQCAMARHRVAAVRHTTLIEVAVFTSEKGDSTVELADNGEVELWISGITFSSPETVLLAETRRQEQHQLTSNE